MPHHVRFDVAAVVAVVLLAAARPLAVGPAGGADDEARDARIRAAIVDAVQARVGEDARVAVEAMDVVGEASAAFLQAVPEPNARLGEPIQFRLLGADGRGATARAAGAVSARLSVDVEHVRVVALVPRGRELADGDVEATSGTVTGVPLRRLPRLSEVAGTRALVNLAPGEIVTKSAVAVRPAVKSGQIVRATARVGGLIATAALVAVQDGAPGAVIRVVNKDSRRELKARVIEPGVVEVIP